MAQDIVIKAKVVDGLLTYSSLNHPKEAILLLRGTRNKKEIIVKDLIIPPLALHGYSYASFPLYMVPMDSSIIGTAHSHPSGITEPSLEDLSNFYGAIMAIIGFPYTSERNIKVFDRNGNKLSFIIEDQR
ncbi:MAG: Mov34/MPN/PAD-1 family protein [Nitrososphaeria archaeon]